MLLQYVRRIISDLPYFFPTETWNPLLLGSNLLFSTVLLRLVLRHFKITYTQYLLLCLFCCWYFHREMKLLLRYHASKNRSVILPIYRTAQYIEAQQEVGRFFLKTAVRFSNC